MGNHHFELVYHLKLGFGPAELIKIIGLAIEEMGFDESTLYDLIIEKSDHDRISCESAQSEIAGRLNNEAWPDIHRIILTSCWIKDMNLKIYLVRRSDNVVLNLKGEMEDAERRERMAEEIEKSLTAFGQLESSAETHDQKRERLFGAMLLEPGVVQSARQPFLAGDFRKALTAASGLFVARLQNLLNVKLGEVEKINELLTQDPPRILFADLSGTRLQKELKGLSGLVTGCLTLLDPIIKGREPAPGDPALVLKFLVLISMIIERLEGGIPNPAAGAASAKTGKKSKLFKRSRIKKVSSKKVKTGRRPAKAAGKVKLRPGRIKTVVKKTIKKSKTVKKKVR
jgi:hypothetical protein